MVDWLVLGAVIFNGWLPPLIYTGVAVLIGYLIGKRGQRRIEERTDIKIKEFKKDAETIKDGITGEISHLRSNIPTKADLTQAVDGADIKEVISSEMSGLSDTMSDKLDDIRKSLIKSIDGKYGNLLKNNAQELEEEISNKVESIAKDYEARYKGKAAEAGFETGYMFGDFGDSSESGENMGDELRKELYQGLIGIVRSYTMPSMPVESLELIE